MATKRTWDSKAELRALNYLVPVLIVTHPDRPTKKNDHIARE